MRAILFLTVFGSLLSLPRNSAAQEADQTKRFSGRWEARVKDSVVCTIELRVADNVSGAMSGCQIHVDGDGNLEEAERSDRPSKPSPISNTRIRGEVLEFDYKEEGETEAVKFEMRLVKDGSANLTVTNAPVKIKPIRFIRVSSK